MSKVALVTGASSGLGLSLSNKFVDAGSIVFGVSRTKKKWKTAIQKVGKTNRFFLVQADLTQESQVKRLIAMICKKAGRIDVLVNNAAYGGGLATVATLSVLEFQKHLSHNLLSAFLMCKHSIPFFRKQKSGLIINVSSMAGKRAVPRLAAYSASKFGVLALSQCVAKENSDAGLKCITICPGGMNTKMRAQIFGKEDANKQQSTDFVAGVILRIIQGEIPVDSGGDVVIRHGQITAVNPPPPA